jgi:hypothetical protein
MADQSRRNKSAVKARRWLELIQKQQASGMSIRSWCRRENLSEASYHWWKRKLIRLDSEACFKKPHPSEPMTFTEIVRPELNESRVGNAGYEIILDQPMRVRVGKGFDPHDLGRILSLLQETRTC